MLFATDENENSWEVTELISWESSDEGVIVVSSQGIMTGRATGTATLTATYKELSSIHNVTVQALPSVAFQTVPASPLYGTVTLTGSAIGPVENMQFYYGVNETWTKIGTDSNPADG